MGVYRLYSGEDGESHVEELTAEAMREIKLEGAEMNFSVSQREPVRQRDETPMPSTPGKRQLDLFGEPLVPPVPVVAVPPAEEASDVAVVTILEGVVDLAFREPDGWVIADYKTDVGTDPDFATREIAYRRQVELYAEAWSRLTGERVKERVLFFTAQDRIESW